MMVSIKSQIKKLAGLQGTKDISSWEDSFIESIMNSTDNGITTTNLTSKQLAVIDSIYSKHFVD